MKTLILPASKPSRAARLDTAHMDRDPNNPLHWMPVPFPGLSVAQLQRIMQEVDRRHYTPRRWLQTLPPSGIGSLNAEVDGMERDANNPLNWMPVPPPVISCEQIEAKVEAVALV